MLVLLDACVPQPLRSHIVGHEVVTARQRNWERLKNGALLAQMRAAGFEILVTVDANLHHQQNLQKAGIGVIVLKAKTNRLDDLIPLVPQLLEALAQIKPGAVIVVSSGT